MQWRATGGRSGGRGRGSGSGSGSGAGGGAAGGRGRGGGVGVRRSKVGVEVEISLPPGGGEGRGEGASVLAASRRLAPAFGWHCACYSRPALARGSRGVHGRRLLAARERIRRP